MSVYAIGDVQGCYQELLSLLDLIQFSPEHDQLWFAGDLVNRGENSLAVLRLIKSLKAKVVLGNHDLHLLAASVGARSLHPKDNLQQVLSAPDADSLLAWLRQQPLLHYDPQYNAVLVHAGLPPHWDLPTALSLAHEIEMLLRHETFTELLTHMYGNEPTHWNPCLSGWPRYRYIINALTRMRFCDLNGGLNFDETGPPGSQPSHLIPWFALPSSRPDNLLILFGHWAALNGETHQANCIALDTGCVWGGKLSAIRLDDRKWFSVNRIGIKHE